MPGTAEVQVRPGVEEDLKPLTDLYNHYVRETPITFDTEPFTPDPLLGVTAPDPRHTVRRGAVGEPGHTVRRSAVGIPGDAVRRSAVGVSGDAPRGRAVRRPRETVGRRLAVGESRPRTPPRAGARVPLAGTRDVARSRPGWCRPLDPLWLVGPL